MLLILNNRINDCRFDSRTLRLSKTEIHFFAFSNEYIKAPAEIAREERNIPIMAANFSHLVKTSSYFLVTIANRVLPINRT